MRIGIKGLVIWNIVLTVLLIAGFLGGILMQNRFINLTNERILALSESLNTMNTVMNQHAEVISQHANIINQNNNLKDGKCRLFCQCTGELKGFVYRHDTVKALIPLVG